MIDAKTYKWNLNPNFTQEWYENMIKNVGDRIRPELDLIRNETLIKKEISENKSEIKPIRFDNEMLNNIGKRLIELDKNLSDYIRGLVEKDLKENNITS